MTTKQEIILGGGLLLIAILVLASLLPVMGPAISELEEFDVVCSVSSTNSECGTGMWPLLALLVSVAGLFTIISLTLWGYNKFGRKDVP